MAGNAVYLSDGETIDYTPDSAVGAGDVIDLGDLVGIAVRDIAASEQGALNVVGMFSVDKKSGETWTQGEPLYWDAGTGTFTNTSAYSEAAAGFAAADAASGDTQGRITLTPGIARS